MRRGLAAILVLSGLLKVALAVAFADLPPRYDEEEFLAFGRAVAAGGEPVTWRAPGYQAFLGMALALGGGSDVVARVLQALLSVVTTWLVWRVGRRAFNGRAAIAAAAFVAFYPPLVAFSHLLWSETLYLAIAAAALERLLASRESGRGRDAALGGALLGLASLVRSTGLILLAASAAWMLMQRAPRMRRLATAAAGAAVILIAPWSLAASMRSGRFVAIDTNGGYNLWLGNSELVPRDLQALWAVGLPLSNGTDAALGARLASRGLDADFAHEEPLAEWRAVVGEALAREGVAAPSDPAAEGWFRREAVRAIREDPAGFVTRVPLRLAGLWSPDVFLLRHLARDWYGPVPPWLAAALVAMTVAASAVPLVLGAAGVVSLRASPFRDLALAWIAPTLAVHAVTFGVSRMHEPLVPWLVLAAAACLLDARERWRPAGAGVAALALAGWLVAAPAAAGLYVVPGPAHADLARALGAARHLPVPGTRWAAWMVARVEMANGRDAAAERILAEPRHAQEAWSLWLRALAAPDPGTSAARVDEALARDPDLGVARALRAALGGGAH